MPAVATKPKWMTVERDVVAVLSCLSDVPQLAMIIGADLGVNGEAVTRALRTARGQGWRVDGECVEGYTLDATKEQKEWLSDAYTRLCAEEDEADADIQSGQCRSFDTVDDLVADLQASGAQ